MKRLSLPIYMICPICGRVTSTDSGYCRHCRAPLFPYTLLETPPEAYDFDIPIGTDREGRDVGLRLDDLSKHLGVFGLTGFGKTNFVKVLIKGLVDKDTNVLVFDWEGEYKDMADVYDFKVVEVEKGIGINVFETPRNVDIEEYSLWLSDLLSSLYSELYGDSLSPPMRFVLNRSIRENLENGGDFESLLVLFKKYSSELPSRTITYSALYTRFEFFTSEFMKRIFSGSPIGFSQNLIFDLSNVSRTSPSIARFVVILLLRMVFDNSVIRSSGKMSKIAIIEEAEEIVGKGLPSLNVLRFLLRARKRGLGLVIVAHSPSLVDESLLKSISNVAVFRLGDLEDAKKASSMLGLSFENSRMLVSLKMGEAVVRTFSSSSPFIVKVMKYKVEEERFRLAEMLLKSIILNPFLSMRARRAELGFSSSQYKRAEEILVSRGIVKPVYVVVGRGRPLKLYGSRKKKGVNVAHKYAVYYIRKKSLEIFGRNIFVENYVSDLYSSELSLCIEVETGTNVFQEKYRRLEEMCEHLIIVPVTKQAISMLKKHVLGKRAKVLYLYDVPSYLKSFFKEN